MMSKGVSIYMIRTPYVLHEHGPGIYVSRRLEPGRFHGLLQTPGGTVEGSDRTNQRAAQRETFEETGLDLKLERFITFGDLLTFKREDGSSRQLEAFYVLVTPTEVPLLMEADKNTDWYLKPLRTVKFIPDAECLPGLKINAETLVHMAYAKVFSGV